LDIKISEGSVAKHLGCGELYNDMLCAVVEYRLSPAQDYRSSLSTVQQLIDILKSTLAAVSRPSFSYDRRIVVEFAGEDGQDNGGPRHKYCGIEMHTFVLNMY